MGAATSAAGSHADRTACRCACQGTTLMTTRPAQMPSDGWTSNASAASNRAGMSRDSIAYEMASSPIGTATDAVMNDSMGWADQFSVPR